MTLHKAFDGEVYYWWDDDRQQASKVRPKREPVVTNKRDNVPERIFVKACHPASPNHNCTWNISKTPQDSVEYVRADLLTTARKEARAAAFRDARKAIENMEVIITRFQKRSADMNGWYSAIEQAHKAIEAAANTEEGGGDG